MSVYFKSKGKQTVENGLKLSLFIKNWSMWNSYMNLDGAEKRIHKKKNGENAFHKPVCAVCFGCLSACGFLSVLYCKLEIFND